LRTNQEIRDVEKRVTIDERTWKWLEHDVHRGAHLVRELRAAGVPVSGAIWPHVTQGTLSQTYDDLLGVFVWTFVP
jgi:hypothetical protein